MPEQYDCIVIGSGPGGYVAAIRAAQLGMKTAVVEKDAVGGRCLNYACIPAKAVLRVADILSEVDDADEFGIEIPSRTVDFSKVSDRRAKVVKTLTGGVSGLFKKNKIDYIEGTGSLVGGTVASFATGIYGGYFGAAQGIILMSLLRFCFPDDLQRLNALKNVLTGVANGVAAILFIAVADVAWEAAGLIAVGSVVGAQVGARYGRHIPSEVLRWIVVIGGTIVALILIFT